MEPHGPLMETESAPTHRFLFRSLAFVDKMDHFLDADISPLEGHNGDSVHDDSMLCMTHFILLSIDISLSTFLSRTTTIRDMFASLLSPDG